MSKLEKCPDFRRTIVRVSRAEKGEGFDIELSCGHVQRWEALAPPIEPSCLACLLEATARMQPKEGTDAV